MYKSMLISQCKQVFAVSKAVLLFVFLSINVSALSSNNKYLYNNKTSASVMSLHLFGDAAIVSLQYEYLFLNNETTFFTAGAGLGYQEEFFLNHLYTKSPPDTYLSIPHHLSFNFGSGNKYAELGIGASVMHGNTSQNYFIYPMAGVRFHPESGTGFTGRIYAEWPIYPAYSKINDILFIPFGMCLGYAF